MKVGNCDAGFAQQLAERIVVVNGYADLAKQVGVEHVAQVFFQQIAGKSCRRIAR